MTAYSSGLLFSHIGCKVGIVKKSNHIHGLLLGQEKATTLEEVNHLVGYF